MTFASVYSSRFVMLNATEEKEEILKTLMKIYCSTKRNTPVSRTHPHSSEDGAAAVQRI